MRSFWIQGGLVATLCRTGNPLRVAGSAWAPCHKHPLESLRLSVTGFPMRESRQAVCPVSLSDVTRESKECNCQSKSDPRVLI